jgi:hypothetical protein
LAKTNTDRKRSSYVEKDCLEKKKKHNDCSRGESRTEYVFILKILFEQKLSDVDFTKTTSTVGLQFLNLRLLKIMLTCVNNGVDLKTWTLDDRKKSKPKLFSAFYAHP